MEYDNFKEWCRLKEPKLNNYFNNYRILDFSLFIGMGLFIFLFWFFGKIEINFLQSEIDIENFKFFSSLIFSAIVFIILVKVFRLPMNKIEFVSCLLYKISKEIDLCESEKDRKELIRDLKIFKQQSKFVSRSANENLFKKENKAQKEFFNFFNSIPDKIYYKINRNKQNEINSEDIKKLAFYTYTDDDQKIQILNKIVKDIPNIKEIEFRPIFPFRKLWKNDLFKIVTICVLLGLIFYFFVYQILGIGKGHTFIGFIALISSFASIIFKK